MWVFVPLKCRQNFEILLVWILTSHTFQKKCPWCMTFAQAIVFQSYFIEITTLISIGLQLSHNSGSKFLKNFSKSRFLAILSYHYGFSKINNSDFYFTCIIPWSTMNPEKMKSIWSKSERLLPKKYNTLFLG